MKMYIIHFSKSTILSLVLFAPVVIFAQEQQFFPLVGIPGVDENAQSFTQYIDELFVLAVGIAAALAVVKIIMAGVQYMFSEIVTQKEEAKKDLTRTFLGLLLILAAVVILNEINPNLTNFDIFRNADPIRVEGGVPSATHDEIRERIQRENPIVGSIYTGELGTSEHDDFLDDCRSAGGQGHGTSEGVECRFSGL